jgi:hypothetical protein
MNDIDNITASQRILAHLHEGRLVQYEWHSVTAKGRDLACILGAISPHIDDSTKCPASVMPAWLASLTFNMFDGQLEADALAWAGRFGQQMAQWHRLDDAAWDRVREAFCAACVTDAEKSVVAAAAFATAAGLAQEVLVAAKARAAEATAATCAYAAVAVAAAANADVAARASCWARLATALCDLIDAELAALADHDC